MKNTYNQKRAQGFTIIEVMIVLAIAAVILLIVLLAVPALQRNSRNTQRNNDAAQLAAAINSCLANNNGNPANCQATGTNAVDVQITNGIAVKYGQLTTPPTWTNNGQMGTVNQAHWTFGYNCGGGNTPTSGGSARAFIVTFQSETTGTAADRCVES